MATTIAVLGVGGVVAATVVATRPVAIGPVRPAGATPS
jgi:hypothetical protein